MSLAVVVPPGASNAAREAFAKEASRLWAVLYRMTGSAADADDLLQETFARALERPPADLERPLGPWLMRVALNLSRDHLRARRRGPRREVWLPSPIPEDEVQGSVEPMLPSGASAEHRYDLIESVSFAFLLALEVLSPVQRAVLLLRDVFDYTAAETAEALDRGEAQVRQIHLRARRRLEAERERRPTFTDDKRGVVAQFLAQVAAGDIAAIEALLSKDVRALSDGGGEFHAALRPIVGPDKVARFFAKLAAKTATTRVELASLNGQPAAIIELADAGPKQARRFVLLFELAPSGEIASIYAVLATRKLAHVRSDARG